MLVPLCNCNRHFTFIPSKTLLKPSFQTPTCHGLNFPIKPLRRRVFVSAAAAEEDKQTLPQSAIHRIAEKLRSLGYVEESSKSTADETAIPGPNSPGEIFVPLPTRLPKYRVGHTLDTSWSKPENPILEEEEEERERVREEKRSSAPSLAELTLPKEELKRLRTIGIALKKKLKVGKSGITEGILNGIHERWRRTELVKITCEDIWRLNMKRTHELLEKKTGGLVIWRSGSNIILYRGTDYKYPYFLTNKSSKASSSEESPATDKNQSISLELNNSVESTNTQKSHPPLIQGVGLPNRVRFQLPGEAQLAEEADALLEGLGPRFTDWWGYDPLPVDADLLPAVIPGYKRPFRLLPYGVKPKLTNDEMTTLRRLGKPLPCHFVLGRNRKHQGLAAAIVKLWEKCEIVKIAIKRGVENTNSELMAEELKWLTGGSLLSRDKEFIIFYRGKDFLPAAVSSAIEERRKHGMDVSKTWNGNLSVLDEKEHKDGIKKYSAETENDQEFQGLSEERKLSMAMAKKAKAEKLLAELEKEESPQTSETEKEGITEEERYMLRKVGLRMNAFLLLGRRGVFDGTIENMHLHWKYRELVKVCVGRRRIEEVNGIAKTLEAESGGILVAIEPVSKGYEIIVYRGKNYKRPASLRPRTLLSKREAMKRSLEKQRSESLKLHVLELNKNIDELKLGMAKEVYTNDKELKEDLILGFVEQEVDESYNKNVKISHEDPETHRQAQDPANEKAGDSDASSKGSEDTKNPSKSSVHIVKKSKYLFETTEAAKLQSKSSPNKTVTKNGKSGNVLLSNCRRVNSESAELEPSVQKDMNERPRALQLSNKERLLLRKQALMMKKPPVLAVGKSNVVTGVAKAIKAHFEKHPLAIVNIKGRAKGTSIQDVIYNLEQATGSVLVSQEPTKVILYRGWGSGAEPGQGTNSMSQEVMNRPLISPELISAIKLECGLKSANEGAME